VYSALLFPAAFAEAPPLSPPFRRADGHADAAMPLPPAPLMPCRLIRHAAVDTATIISAFAESMLIFSPRAYAFAI
jgi:hypothetical protein